HTAFTAVVAALAEAGREEGGAVAVDKVVGMEARGFILAAPVALALGVGFVPVRKPGKLPWETRAVSYELEYGEETLEMHTDALGAGERAPVLDSVRARPRRVVACSAAPCWRRPAPLGPPPSWSSRGAPRCTRWP